MKYAIVALPFFLSMTIFPIAEAKDADLAAEHLKVKECLKKAEGQKEKGKCLRIISPAIAPLKVSSQMQSDNGALKAKLTDTIQAAPSPSCAVTAESGGPGIQEISSPVRMRVYQRRGGAGNIPVNTKTSAEADCVQARVVADDTTSVIVPWQTVAEGKIEAQQNLAAEINTPNGGWYFVEVRAIKKGAAGAIAKIDFIGVGEVFITAGQSNSTFHGSKPQKSATGKVSYFDGAEWKICEDPLLKVDGSTGGAAWCLLGDNIVKGWGVPVAFAPVGYGGTSIEQWQKNSATSPQGKGVLFGRLVEVLKYFGPNQIRAVLWHQGESDIGNTQDHYASKLLALIQGSREGVNAATPWLISRATYPNDWSSSKLEVWQSIGCKGECVEQRNKQRLDILAAQSQLVGAGEVYAGPDTDALVLAYRAADGVHFNEIGLEVKAALWSEKISNAFRDKILSGEQ